MNSLYAASLSSGNAPVEEKKCVLENNEAFWKITRQTSLNVTPALPPSKFAASQTTCESKKAEREWEWDEGRWGWDVGIEAPKAASMRRRERVLARAPCLRRRARA